MEFQPRDLSLFAVFVVAGFGLLLLLDAGHIFWPMLLIIAGAYVVPTLYVKLRNALATRRSEETKDLTNSSK